VPTKSTTVRQTYNQTTSADMHCNIYPKGTNDTHANIFPQLENILSRQPTKKTLACLYNAQEFLDKTYKSVHLTLEVYTCQDYPTDQHNYLQIEDDIGLYQ